MTHKYQITGMTCDGCRSKVEKTLNSIEGIKATVVLLPPVATLTMEKHIPIAQLQEVLTTAGKYTISVNNSNVITTENSKNSEVKSCCSTNKLEAKDVVISDNNTSGKYHCPMHCEGNKNYDKAGDCPVCGMNLEKVHELNDVKTLFTCPMHPEVIKEQSGSCPICGMDLVPMNPSDIENQKTYKDLVKKMKIAVVFTVPVFAIAMIEMMNNSPLLK